MAKKPKKKPKNCQMHPSFLVKDWFYSSIAKGGLCPGCIIQGLYWDDIHTEYLESKKDLVKDGKEA